ncbi:hypothetical protein IKF74_01640 [Candidatus Saccharibacteria bacterium]|nr:hypothetical protein [Candidatus Saccharibacteria bacterium]
MNKETIYIEPSDDITDILSKLKASDKKIVALVPPKKPTVLLSSVNVKLIARTAKSEKKAVVLITTDDALTKLAMTANLPVAKSLKSRPVMPGEEPKPEEKPAAKSEAEDEAEAETEEEDAGEDEGEPETETTEDKDETEEEEPATEAEEEDEDAVVDSIEKEESKEDDNDEDDDDEDDEKPKDKKKDKKDKKAKKEKSDATGIKGFIVNHKIWVILGAFLLVAITGFLIWAFAYAPEVSVAVSVRTTSSNFSENVIFTTQPADEDVEKSTFYAHEEKLEKEQVVKFTATGKKDMGESATGEIIAIAYFLEPGSIDVPAGSEFSHGAFKYLTLAAATIVGPAKKTASAYKTACDNYSDDNFEISVDYCQVSIAISIKAAAPGEDYNLSATNEGWSAPAGLNAVTRTDITGGTSKIVTVVQQSDIDVALDKMKSESGGDGKNELLAKLSNTVTPIEASFKVEATDPKVTPAVGEEVKEGVTPQISTKTSYSVLTVDSVRIEEFIKKKATIEEGKRLYSVGEPFVEYFSKSDDKTYSAKLKTTYKVGPEISETEVLEKIQGEKIGRIEPVLKDAFQGISSVKTEKSYFWVNSVPNDPNKIHIELTVEE